MLFCFIPVHLICKKHMELKTGLLIGRVVGKSTHPMEKNKTGSLPNVVKIIEKKMVGK